MEPTPVVYLFVPIEFSYGREIIRGVREYTQKNRMWQLAVAEPSVKNIRALKREKPDGVIGLFSTPEMEEAVRALKIPAVSVSSMCKGNKIPGVIPQNAAISRLAAQHFLERGFHHFAFAGIHEHFFSRDRQQAFGAALKEAGFDCHFLPDGQDTRSIRALPKPVAIMACSDGRAKQLMLACVRSQAKVPGEVAIVGVDNDEAMCELAEVPLSSIDPNGATRGNLNPLGCPI